MNTLRLFGIASILVITLGGCSAAVLTADEFQKSFTPGCTSSCAAGGGADKEQLCQKVCQCTGEKITATEKPENYMAASLDEAKITEFAKACMQQ